MFIKHFLKSFIQLKLAMKPFVTNKRVLQWLYVYPLNANASKWMKWACVVFALFVFTSLLVSLISSAVFFWKFVSNDLELALFALYQVAGAGSVGYVVLIAFIMRKEITTTIDQLPDIYSVCKNLVWLKTRTLNRKKNLFRKVTEQIFCSKSVKFYISVVAPTLRVERIC